jgi:hypothetical protein
MAKKYTILQFADRLEKIATPKQLNKAILPPFRKGLKIMQRALYAEYWSNRFGARIWRWQINKFGKGGPSVKLGSRRRRSYARWSSSESAYVGRIIVSGMAAKMEEGGNLRRHVPYGREELARSPGLPVPRSPTFERVVERTLWGYIAESFGRFVERTL